jgi:hypothetical protein
MSISRRVLASNLSLFCFLQVQQHFKSYNLLNERVLFHKGFFRDSLPSVPVAQLAVIRADGDMYESTMDILFNLYGKLSVGGYVIIDDWPIPVAQEAVFDFARWHDFLDDVNNRVSEVSLCAVIFV